MKTNSLFKRLVSMLIVVLMICTLLPTTALAAQNTGHSIAVRFTVLYVDSSFYTGYNYGSSENTTFICQYSTPHSDTAYSNHTIAISDIAAAAGRATVDSGYEIVGWAKDASSNPKIFSLTAPDNTACNKGSTIYLVAKRSAPVKPSKPTNNELENNLLKSNAVKIDCTNRYAEGHGDRTYGLLAGSYNVSEPTLSGDKYTCTVTVDSTKYIEQYNSTNIDAAHSLANGESASKTITLKHNGTGWVVDSAVPVVFTVDCNTPAPAPQPPSKEYLEGLLANGAVTIHCIKDTEYNDDETYGLIPNSEGVVSYSIGKVDGNANDGYTCDITVYPAPYAEQYNSDKHSKGFTNEHTLCPDQSSKTITLKHNGTSWVVDSTVPVVFTVDCNTPAPAPQPPSKEYLERLLANGAVTIHCTTEESHQDATYGLIPNSEGVVSYSIGKVDGNANDGYTCDITVYAAPYVDQYIKDRGNVAHKLVTVPNYATITLIYNGQGWGVVRPERSTAPAPAGVTFNVVCEETPVTTYTVTYKDGVGGKVFKDDVHTVKSGATTPAFVGGIPTRPGYVFVGWTPAVSRCVTGNATYTATWRKVKDTTVIEIGGGNSSSSSSKEENPNTGAPVFVGVSVGALAAAK